MKKLLLLIVPLLLLFGVSLGQTWEFNWLYSATTSSVGTIWVKFVINGVSWSTINLYSIQHEQNQTGCTEYRLYWSNNPTPTLANSTLIFSWDYTSQNNSGLTLVDKTFTHSFSQYTFAYTCSTIRFYANNNNSLTRYHSWRFTIYSAMIQGNINSRADVIQSDANFYVSSVKFVFSWADPRIWWGWTPITIHYNWTSTGYAGTGLYIDQPVKETYMSWGFLHFIVQRFRTLFRVN